MSLIKPFCGLRPKADYASRLASLPYDVMDTKEARDMAAGNPFSFLHVSRAEIDLPIGTDPHAPEVYQMAETNFRSFINDGILFSELQPSLYIYAQTMNGRRQTGLVACAAIDDYFNGVIKKHELTRPEKEQDRIKHMEALQAHVGPIFLTYPPNSKLNKIISRYTLNMPAYDFTADDGIQHTFWVIGDAEDKQQICRVFEDEVPCTYIADGHHRAASAAKVGLKLRAQNQSHTGSEEYNYFLSVLFPADELAIMDYNRLVKDLNSHSAELFLQILENLFEIFEITQKEAKPCRLHEFGMYFNAKWYRLIAKDNIYTHDPVGVLDVSILQERVLSPILGIEDPRTDKRIDFVGGIRGLEELKRRVDSGEMAVAFALFPVSIGQLMAIADSGKVMPPKSTWFEPKLRDGLISHLF